MTRENGTLAAVRKAERLKGRRTACVLGKNPAATAAIGGVDTDNRGMDGENGYPEASAKEAASRTGRGGDEKLSYPPAGINRQALTDFIGTLWDMKRARPKPCGNSG